MSTLRSQYEDVAAAPINKQMRELAHLSVMITPELQIAPQERQRSRHQAIASKPVQDSLPFLSPMAQRQLELTRKREIENQRDHLRDKIVAELQATYLSDPNNLEYLYPERAQHNDLHNIQFPMKPFLPVEVTEDGQGLTTFPRIVQERQRCKKRVPRQDLTEVKSVLHGLHITAGKGGAEDTYGLTEKQRLEDQFEQADMQRRVLMWKKKQKQTKRIDSTSIFSKEFETLRSGAGSIETKHGIPKNKTCLLPLSGLNCSEATNLGPNAVGGSGRAEIYKRNPQILEERLRNSQRVGGPSNSQLASGREPRTSYERLVDDTIHTARSAPKPTRGHYFGPQGGKPAPDNREVLTYDADIMEYQPRHIPMPATGSTRRVQILSSTHKLY